MNLNRQCLSEGEITLDERSIILIVDDDPIERSYLKKLLGGEGYRLVLASDGSEALSKAAEVTPDLVLLDVVMPDMNGFEVCRRLRADPILAEVPIIIVTALDDSAACLRGLEIGADDFVTKPFNRVELLARVRTITRLNRYRRLLFERAQRQQAEESERFKDRFISNISHELRTPLSVITLLSGNLDALYEYLNDEKRHQMIRDVRKQAQVLNELVENVLETSRLENRRRQEQQWINLVDLVKKEVDEQRPLAHQNSHRLSLEGVEYLSVWGNDHQLRQVIRNLLNNAIKYTPAHGQITCECLQLTAPAANAPEKQSLWPGQEALAARPWAVMRVTDTGIGINPEEIPHLFERFYRVKSQSNVPGSGLGLSIARELIELHQGQIAVASTPGQGSTFAVYLPLRKANET